MLASLANYFFSLKSQKMRYVDCVLKFQLWKLGCPLTWQENVVPQLRNYLALQLNQKAHCGGCAVLKKLKKLNCKLCALLRCAFDIMLFVPTSGK